MGVVGGSVVPPRPALGVPALPNPSLLAAFPGAEILKIVRVVSSHVGFQSFFGAFLFPSFVGARELKWGDPKFSALCKTAFF